MTIKLSTKIVFIAAFPTLFYVILGILRIQESVGEYRHTSQIKHLIEALTINSRLLSNAMEERGRSDYFLRTGDGRTSVEALRNKGDQLYQELETSLKVVDFFSQESLEQVALNNQALMEIRRRVDDGVETDADEIYRAYTEVVDETLDVYLRSASLVKIAAVSARIQTLALLASSKAFTGVLRSAITRIVSDDLPLSGAEVRRVVALRTHRDASLDSKAMILSKGGQASLGEMRLRPHWKDEEKVFTRIIANRARGDFGFGADAVFGVYSSLINDITHLADTEGGELLADLERRNADALSGALIVSFAVAGAAILVFLFLFIVVRELNKSVTGVVGGLVRCAADVASSSDKVLTSANALSSGASESASSIEEVTASVQEISTMVKRNADNSNQANTLSQESRRSALHGQTEINRLIESIDEISRSSEEMENIIKVIDEIAFQTNLLALNAAVEAARAGDQGKGFAVVADAVRTLAQKSAESASNIANLIKDNIAKSAAGSEIAEVSREVLQEIVDGASKVAELVGEISTASTEQSRGIESVSQALVELDRVSQETATSASDAAESGIQISHRSDDLAESVATLNRLINGTDSVA